MNYDISVVIPVHNAEKCMVRAVESVLQQKGITLQIILIENGSTDTSTMICDEYADKYPHIESYHLQSGNVSLARNKGLEHAKGRYISFVDADDYIEPGMYAELLEKGNSASIIFFDYYRCMNGELVSGESISENDDFLGCELDARQIRQEFIGPDNTAQVGVMASVWRGIYRRDFLERKKMRFNSELQIGEDMLFLIQMLSYCEKIRYIKKEYYYYTVDGTSVTSTFGNNSWKKYEKMFCCLIRELESKEEIIENSKRIFVKLYGISKWLIAEIAKSSLKWKDKEAQINEIYFFYEQITKKIICKKEASRGVYDWLFQRKYIKTIIVIGKIVKYKQKVWRV